MRTLRHQTQPGTTPVTSDGLRRNQLALEDLIEEASAGVLTFNTRSGIVTLTAADVGAALSSLVNAVDDAAAAASGVAVGRVYRNGSVLMIRVA